MENVIPPPFEPLSRLFRGDAARVRRALEIFERVTAEDLRQLDAAYAGRDWATIASLAHKMKSGCLQIGEAAAAAGLAFIERTVATGGTAIDGEFATTRHELDGVMMRIADYLGTTNEAGGQ